MEKCPKCGNYSLYFDRVGSMYICTGKGCGYSKTVYICEHCGGEYEYRDDGIIVDNKTRKFVCRYCIRKCLKD